MPDAVQHDEWEKDHPSRAELERFVSGSLSEELLDNIGAHVERCDKCANLIRNISMVGLVDQFAEAIDHTRSMDIGLTDKDRLLRAIDALPDPHRTVIRMCYVERQSIKSICQATGYSTEVAASLVRQGLEWLEPWLNN